MPHILVNLPAGFFRTPQCTSILVRLEALGAVRYTSHNTAQEIQADLAWADIVLMWAWPKLDEALLDNTPNLKLAAHLDLVQGAGEIALRRGLPVSQGRAAFSPAVAEMALTLILTSLRRTSTFHQDMAEHRETWVRSFPNDIDPLERELTGLPVGIVGFGRIGQRLAELLAPFHCPLFAIDPFVSEEILARFQAQRITLEEAIPQIEVLVLCAASNEGTRHLLSTAHIEALRPHSVLVNVARSAIVDTQALLTRLQKGDIFAALDVFDQEPLASDHPLRGLHNAYLTPHRAGGILASVERILLYLVNDIERFLRDEPLLHPLTPAMLPALDR